MVSRAISAAGTITAQGFSASPVRFSLIMVPQLGDGRRLAEAEEGQARHDDDRVGQPQPGLHHQRGAQAGQDLLGHHRGRAHPLQLGHLDEVPLGDVQGRRPQHPGDGGRVGQPDGQHDQPQLGAQDAQQQQGEDQLGEGQDHVDGPHDQPVGAPAQVGGADPGGRSRGDPEHRRGRPPSAAAASRRPAPGTAHRGRGSRRRAGTARTASRTGRSAARSAGAGPPAGRATATATTKPASPSPVAPRGVRTAEPTEASHWWRRIRSVPGPQRSSRIPPSAPTWESGAAA